MTTSVLDIFIVEDEIAIVVMAALIFFCQFDLPLNTYNLVDSWFCNICIE